MNLSSFSRNLTLLVKFNLTSVVIYIFLSIVLRRYGDSRDNTLRENSSVFCLIQTHWLLSAKDMHAEKLCTNKVLQFVTGGDS